MSPAGPIDRCRGALPARWLAALLAAAALAAGCGSSPPTRYHAVEAVLPAALAAPGSPGHDGPALQVRVVQVPPALDRQELVREVAPGQFEIEEFDHWAAPLPRLARQALSQDLAARLAPGRLVFPGAPRPPLCADLSVDILSFKVSGGKASAWISWTLQGPAAAAPASASAPASAPASPAGAGRPPRGAQLQLQSAAGAGPAATAAAFSALLGQLADSIAADLADGKR